MHVKPSEEAHYQLQLPEHSDSLQRIELPSIDGALSHYQLSRHHYENTPAKYYFSCRVTIDCIAPSQQNRVRMKNRDVLHSGLG